MGSEKLGRNDPCSCGSGRKYKHCCLRAREDTELRYARLRRAEGKVASLVSSYIFDELGESFFAEAWEAFTLGSELLDPREAEERRTLFLDWTFFTWVPASQARGREWPIAMRFVHAAERALDELEKRLVTEVCTRPFTFLSVAAVDPGRGMSLDDIFTRRRWQVIEHSGSKNAEIGQIIYGRPMSLDGLEVMMGFGPLLIPPRYHVSLLDLRDELCGEGNAVDESLLRALDDDLRDEYLRIRDELFNPRMPQLQNTDGDPLVLTKLDFDLSCSPADAFAALASLALGREGDEALRDPEYDPDGNLCACAIDWIKSGNALHKDWENTALGSLRIDGPKLTAEVNSQQRAEALRREVETRLGARAAFKVAKSETAERALEERRGQPSAEKERRGRQETERLMALPEVQQQVQAMAARHWEAWFDEKIPALRGESPREAARTAAGRERLEALLRDYAWQTDPAQDPFAPDVPALRAKLGLG